MMSTDYFIFDFFYLIKKKISPKFYNNIKINKSMGIEMEER